MCIEKWLSIKINLNNKQIKHNYERINHREFHTKAHKTQTKTVFSVFFSFQTYWLAREMSCQPCLFYGNAQHYGQRIMPAIQTHDEKS